MKQNIIITGGNLTNKGAQTMTFIVVDQMRSRFPEKNIYLLSTTDYLSSKKTNSNFSFKILSWGAVESVKTIPFFKTLLFFVRKTHTSFLRNILKDTYMCIDISGYALSSKFPVYSSIKFLLDLYILKHFRIPSYILPQSFGPFQYKPFIKQIMVFLIKRLLKYPDIIYVREKQGYRDLKALKLNDIKLSSDIVLQTDDIKRTNVFIQDRPLKTYNIKKNGIGIVPNYHIFRNQGDKDIHGLYINIISYLSEHDNNVYIISHSEEDKMFCKAIMNQVRNKENVFLIDDDLDFWEIEQLFKQFKYLIASRFHSIVHAYRQGVASIVLGWAIKYYELTDRFNQSNYHIDISDLKNYNQLLDIIKVMENNYAENAIIIKRKIKEIQKENIFNTLMISRN